MRRDLVFLTEDKKRNRRKRDPGPGVISRIVESADPEDPDEDCYVRYQTREGEEIEGLLSNPAAGLEVGQKVWIKYHPKLKQNCRLAN